MIIINEDKLKEFSKVDKSKIHFVLDFDRTVTSYLSESSWSILKNIKGISSNYIEEDKRLFEFYRPIEINNNLDYSYRNKMMNEWWIKHADLIVNSKIKKEMVDNIDYSVMSLRKGMYELLSKCNEYKIPVVILSAGLGDVITNFLKKENVLFDNIIIETNYFKYDTNNYVSGFKNDYIIHALNKKEINVNNNELNLRDKVILMGDQIGDIDMSKSIDIIKIGILEDNIEDRIDVFKNNYDIIILEDDINEIVNTIL